MLSSGPSRNRAGVLRLHGRRGATRVKKSVDDTSFCPLPLPAARFQNDTNAAVPPVLISFYMFNITNLADVRRGARPVLVS